MKTKIKIIKAVPEKKIELYEAYGAGHIMGSSELGMYNSLRIYKQFVPIEKLGSHSLVTIRSTLKEAKLDLLNNLKRQLNEKHVEVNRLKSWIEMVEKDKYKIEELEDDIK